LLEFKDKLFINVLIMKSCCRNIDVAEHPSDMYYTYNKNKSRNKGAGGGRGSGGGRGAGGGRGSGGGRGAGANIDWKKADQHINELSFNGKITKGKVVCVYGKCMFDIVFPIIGSDSNKLYKWACVLNDAHMYDLFDNRVDDLNKLLEHKLLNKVVNVKCCDFNDYGILQVKIYINCVDIMEYIVASGYCFNVGERRDANADMISIDDMPNQVEYEVVV
jgi:hypothetical protein